MSASSQSLVPLFDIRLRDADIEAVAETLRSGWLTMGPERPTSRPRSPPTSAFGTPSRTSSCTTALHLAYLAAGVGPGDEVIVPAITFVATRRRGALLRRHPGPRRHPRPARPRARPRLGGGAPHGANEGRLPRPLRRLRRRRRALRELCDAPRPGADRGRRPRPQRVATDGGRKLGTLGLAGCFSFFSNKVLSCGEGGMLATDNEEVAALARQPPFARDDLRHLGPPSRPLGRL